MAVVRINIPSKAGLPDEWESIRPHFPMPSPRRYQAEALSVVWWALKNDDFDNIVVQAPTGIGKSAIARTLQTQFQSAYLLTPSLGLAEQYKRDYGHTLAEVRGRSNFPRLTVRPASPSSSLLATRPVSAYLVDTLKLRTST